MSPEPPPEAAAAPAPWDAALLDRSVSPFAENVVRLEADRPPPRDSPGLRASLRRDIRAAIDAVIVTGQASLLLVKGDPGQGKTHELARLRAEAREGQAFHFVQVPPLKEVGGPFGHVLRHAVQSLSGGGALDRILWSGLRRVAREASEHARERGDDQSAARLEHVLAGSGKYVRTFAALAQADGSLGELLHREGRSLPTLSALDPDLARVLCRIPDGHGEAALDWLRGAELPDEELRLLGVTRALDSESRCFDTLSSLARLTADSHRPLVLCFDQVESVAALLGGAGVEQLFTALMELYQDVPVCAVVMCQTQVWSERLQPFVPEAVRDRIRELGVLAKPTADEAVDLVASRLDEIWLRAAVAPPYRSYPFARDWMARYVDEERPRVREVLMRCHALLEEMRRTGRIALQGDESAKPLPDEAHRAPTRGARRTVAPSEALAEEHRRQLALVGEREELRQPKLRQDRLRGAIVQVLQAARGRAHELGRARVIDVESPPRPPQGPRPPLRVRMQSDRGPVRRIAVDVHNEDARGAVNVLRRLLREVREGRADVGALLRETGAPIGQRASTTTKLAEELSPGGIVWIETEAAHRLVAAELLLDAVSAAEVWAGGGEASRAVGRDEALSWLLEHDVLAPLEGLVSRVFQADALAPPLQAERARPAIVTEPSGLASLAAAGGAGRGDGQSGSELSGRIIDLLAGTSAMMPAPRIADALGVAPFALAPALDALESGGFVRLARDREQVQVVILTRPTGQA